MSDRTEAAYRLAGRGDEVGDKMCDCGGVEFVKRWARDESFDACKDCGMEILPR